MAGRPGGDFQDFPAWRQSEYEVLDLILRSAGGAVGDRIRWADRGITVHETVRKVWCDPQV